MRHSYLPLLGVLAIGCVQDAPPSTPKPTLLSPVGAHHLAPAYSPDGTRAAGWQRSGAEFQLWLADSDLGNLTLLPLHITFPYPLTWSPDGTRLAVPRPGETNWGIATVPAAGGDATPIYTGAGLIHLIGWSGDGSKILAFAPESGGSFATQVIDVATGTAEPLLPGERRAHTAVFAPVGGHLVVMIYDSARSTLWGMDSLGATPRQLTTEGYEYLPNTAALWSPDGRELVYESIRTGAPDLWVLDFVTGTSRQLTNDLRADRRPSWSPDGKWILFESERGRQTDLWVVPAAGGDAIRLTDDPAVERVIGWRGGSQHVAFTIEGGSGSVHAVPIAGGEERQLTPDSVTVDYFQASTDGSQIAFTSRRTGSVLDIWVMQSDGGEPRLLASPQADNARLLWSPDGTHLLFSGTAGGTLDPWIIEVATGALRQVLTWDSWEWESMWGRDGNELLVLSDLESRFADLWRVSLDGGAPVRVTTEGRINELFTTLDSGTRPLVSLVGGDAGQIGLGEVMPDGTLRPITEAQSVWSVSWNTPHGRDSVAAQLAGDDGKTVSVMMSLADGGTRPLGPPGARVGFWSHSGRFLAYTVGTDQGSAVGVIDMTSGTARTLTPGTGLEGGTEFLPGDSVVVFRRNRPENRIAVMDLAELLSRAR